MCKWLALVMLLFLTTEPATAQSMEGAEEERGLEAAEEAYQRKDYRVAARIWEKLARQGSARAQFNLGVMNAAGRGMPKDDAKAAYWHEKAARQGYARAQTMLGIMYNDGVGVTKNYVLAYMWYSIAAENGHAPGASFRDDLARNMTAEQLAKAKTNAAACGKKPATCP